MAGMPKTIVQRAQEILLQLEEQKDMSKEIKGALNALPIPNKNPMQLNIFEMDNSSSKQIKDALTTLDINALTPIEALLKLSELKKMLEE